jgi:hypothetical protein
VWDVDCSSFFPPEVDSAAIHGAYFVNEGTLNLMRHVLRSIDRGVLETLGYTAARHGQSCSERRRIPARSRKLKSRSANHSPSQRKPPTAPTPKWTSSRFL